ncbi:MAG: hypothetical protein WDZ85_00835 [Candidatus Paceibacterota bacterium]
MDKNSHIPSFIPQKPDRSSRPIEAAVGLATVAGFIFLAIALVFFAGTYGYRYYLTLGINRSCDSERGCGLRESLAREKAQLDIERVSRLAAVDAKMKAAREVINNHTNTRPLFDFLEAHTLHNIRFTAFEFDQAEGIKLSGLAQSYEDIGVQWQVFKNSPVVTGTTFSKFGSDEDKRISFDLNLGIHNDFLKYRNN